MNFCLYFIEYMTCLVRWIHQEKLFMNFLLCQQFLGLAFLTVAYW